MVDSRVSRMPQVGVQSAQRPSRQEAATAYAQPTQRLKVPRKATQLGSPVGINLRLIAAAAGPGPAHDLTAHPLGKGDGQTAADAKEQAGLIWACVKKRAAQMNMRLRLADGRVISPELNPEEAALEEAAAVAKRAMYAAYQPGSALLKLAREEAPPAAAKPKPEEHVAALAAGAALRRQARQAAAASARALARVGTVTARPPLLRKAK